MNSNFSEFNFINHIVLLIYLQFNFLIFNLMVNFKYIFIFRRSTNCFNKTGAIRLRLTGCIKPLTEYSFLSQLTEYYLYSQQVN